MNECKFDALKLANQLCFPLYACSRETIKLYKPFLNELDLTYTQYITMLVLWEERSVNVKQLGKRLFLDSGTLTPLLKKLESKGLITRVRSALDERNLIVSITPKGEQMREQALHIPLELAKAVPLTSEEALTLYQLLYKLLGSLPEDTDE
ncbi:MAG: MarR family transcriptional regulator [Clostridia bacterium]|nr:MarR family transcriptional regulator [Clostridia bacterium]